MPTACCFYRSKGRQETPQSNPVPKQVPYCGSHGKAARRVSNISKEGDPAAGPCSPMQRCVTSPSPQEVPGAAGQRSERTAAPHTHRSPVGGRQALVRPPGLLSHAVRRLQRITESHELRFSHFQPTKALRNTLAPCASRPGLRYIPEDAARPLRCAYRVPPGGEAVPAPPSGLVRWLRAAPALRRGLGGMATVGPPPYKRPPRGSASFRSPPFPGARTAGNSRQRPHPASLPGRPPLPTTPRYKAPNSEGGLRARMPFDQ